MIVEKKNLTKNEKRVLKLLLENSNLSDTFIGNKLNISSQAIGRIRKFLEENIIKKYSLEFNPERVGINLFVLCKAKLKGKLDEQKRAIFEKELAENKNIIELIKYIGEDFDYFIESGFKDMNEVDSFYRKENRFSNLLYCVNLKIINFRNILKRDASGLYEKAIDEMGTRNEDFIL